MERIETRATGKVSGERIAGHLSNTELRHLIAHGHEGQGKAFETAHSRSMLRFPVF